MTTKGMKYIRCEVSKVSYNEMMKYIEQGYAANIGELLDIMFRPIPPKQPPIEKLTYNPNISVFIKLVEKYKAKGYSEEDAKGYAHQEYTASNR